MGDDYVRLLDRVAEGKWQVEAELVEGTTAVVRMFGLAGPTEPYQVRIQAASYPVGPWRIGFIDPAAQGPTRLAVPDHDPRYWPFSQLAGAFGGFHVGFAGPYRVFVCLPFSTEYFYYHRDQAWRPDVYDLPRVVGELNQAVKLAAHFSKWWDRIFVGQGR